MSRKSIAIIGAGIGGLTVGALLTKAGYNVTVFEKEKRIGGRALSFEGSSISLQEYKNLLSSFNTKIAFSEPTLEEVFERKLLNDYILDLGYHAIGGGVLSNVNSVLSQLDDHIDFLESYVGMIRKDGYDFPFLSKIDKLKIAPKILRLLFASEKTLKSLDKVSITKTINKYGKGKMKEILEVFSRSITTMNNLDKISTGEMFRAQRNLYKGSKPVGYPIGGLQSINNKLSDFICDKGGKVNLESAVEKIIIEDEKAVGVLSSGKNYSADIVISNVIVQDLFKIVKEKYFPKKYVDYIKSLNGTGSLCAYYSLDKMNPELIGKTFHFIERNVGLEGRDVVGMIDFMSASPKSGLSASSDYLVQSYVICTPNEARDEKTLKKLKKMLDENLKNLIGDYKSNLKWAIYPAIWHLDGVAKTIENDKPEIKTPIKNLYLVGDCVKAPGIGFNCALNSARKLRDIIK